MRSQPTNNIKIITETDNTFTYLLVCTATIAFWIGFDWVGMLLAGKNLNLSVISLHSLITTAISYMVYNVWEFWFTRSFPLILVFRLKK
jgi:hypothetical protein